jgi:valyl-tRNA synthetase
LARVGAHRDLLQSLARTERIEALTDGHDAPESAITLLGDMKLLVPLEGLIDKNAETARLNKEIERLHSHLARAETKLANPDFLERAPKEVVEKEQDRVHEFKTAIDKLNEQLETLSRL